MKIEMNISSEAIIMVEHNDQMKAISRVEVMSNKKMAWVLLVMLITLVSFVDAQTLPSCAEQLSPCIYFMNSTNPPDTCCNPIKVIDATQKSCFCNLGLNPGILQSLGTSTSQAIQLLRSCGVNFNIHTCKASSSALPPSMAPPGADEGSAGRVTFTGLSLVLFLCACVFFN